MTRRREIVDVRLSGSPEMVAMLAGAMTALDGWTVLDVSEAYTNRRDPGERRYLTLRQGYPSVSAITAWLEKNGWEKLTTGPAGALWTKLGDRAGVPSDDSDPLLTKGALERIAATEGADVGELVALIDLLASRPEPDPQPGED